MNARKRILALACLPLITLGACGQQDEPHSEPSTSASSTSAKPTESKSPQPTTSTPQPDTSSSEAAAEPAVAEPYVVECEPSPPGPALWSDGVVRFSQDCYDQGVANRGAYRCPGTDSYVNEPSQCGQSNLGPDLSKIPIANGGTCAAAICGYGTDENGNPNPSSGEIQSWWMNCISANSEEYCRENDPYK